MKNLNQTQEHVTSRYIAREWVKSSKKILAAGRVPAKLSTLLSDSAILCGMVEAAAAIFFSSWLHSDAALSKDAAKRIKDGAIREALWLLKEVPENASLLAHFVARTKEALTK